jgi:hypothetical protein
VSSTYRVLCLSHDPAVEAAEPDGLSRASDMAATGFDDHPQCDLLVARYSGGLIELGCVGMDSPAIDLSRSHTGHPGLHRDTVWADAGLLRVAAACIVTEDDGHAEVITKALGQMPMCWTHKRLHRLRHVLEVAL